MRVGRAALVGAVLVAVVLGPPAQAATPASGVLARTKRVIAFSGGPFYVSETNYVSGGCAAGARDPICDHFALRIKLGDGARIRVSIRTPNANSPDGATYDGDDYDLFVYAPSGGRVAAAETSSGNETLVFTHRARYGTQPYEVRVLPWFVMPGSKYKGTITALTLGR